MSRRWFAAVVLWAAPLAAEAPPVRILSKTPLGRAESRSTDFPITVTFNQPMAVLTSPQDMGDRCPLRVEPAVAGRCRWQGTQTLTFEPAVPWPPATSFRVYIPAGFKSEVSAQTLDREEAWTFETQRPALLESKPHHQERWVDLKAILYMRFTMEMDPRRARDFIALEETVEGRTETVLLGVRRAQPEEIKAVWPYSYADPPASTATVLAAKPMAPLRPNAAYRLIMSPGLLAARGDLGFAQERAVSFTTWMTFRLTQTPSPGCLPGDLEIAFSNSVKRGDMHKHLTVGTSTALPALELYEENFASDRMRLPDLSYKPRETYTFTLSRDLPDKFGNLLGEDKTFSVTMPDYCASVDLPERFGVLEQYFPARHPATLVNVPEIPLAKKRIPDEELIPFFNGIRWNDAAARALKEPPKIWKASDLPNLRLNTFIDLGEVFTEGQGGFAYAELSVPDRWRGSRWAKVLDNVTRVGVSFKSSPDSSLVWATYLRTGMPAKGLPVELRSDENRLLWSGVTGENGLADAPGWVDLGISTWNAHRRPRLWAFVKDPRGTAGLSIEWRGGLEPWRLGVPYEWQVRPETFRGLLFTERGVYRPGETVNLKGLVRRLAKGDWTTVNERRLELTLTDARGQQVLKTTVSLSDLSSFDYAYAVPESAPTGTWSARVTDIRPEAATVESRPVYGDDEGYDEGYSTDSRVEARLTLFTGFRVEAFKPATFEVRVAPEKDAFLAGENFKAVVDGWYLFGAPMVGQPVQWKLRLQNAYFRVPGFEEYDFAPGRWTRSTMESDRLLASAEGTLDDQGKFNLSVPLAGRLGLGPQQALLEASVTSPERQRLLGRRSALVHAANLYLGLRGRPYFIEKGRPWTVDVVALRPDGAWASGRPLAGHLVRRDWLSVRRAGVGNRWEWVSETRDVVVATVTWTSASAARPWTFTPETAGSHFFTVTGVDEEKRPAQAALSFYVIGAGASWWSQNDTDIVELVPEKTAYAPGDTARILVKSPYPKARALVTVEREGMLDRWVTTLEGGAPTISVPIYEKHLPNIFVGVMLIRGRTGEKIFDENGDDLAKPQIKVGYAALDVSPRSRRLSVRVAADKSEYRPGTPVTVTLETQSEGGQPAPAEVTLAVVDEGVLALTGYGTPDPFSALYGPRPLRFDTADNRMSLIGQRNFGEKGENRGGGDGGGGGGGAGAALEGIDLRARFVPTAYWNAAIRTDAQGLGAARFTLPDTLTRFRVMAVAQDVKRFGSGEARLTVKKPFLLKPSLPRFARQGDEFEGGVVIHNYTDKKTDFRVTATAEGDAIRREGEDLRSGTVEPGKALEVLWTFRAEKIGETRFAFRAAAGAETDGLAWRVPVRAPERLETVATSAATESEGIEILRRPPGAVPGLGRVRATLAGTALAGLQEGAQFLLEYPFGCLEQRLSRVLPVVVGADLVETFGLGRTEDLKIEVQKTLDKLPSFQHGGGGYRYWTDAHLPDPYVTSYALEVAALAQKAGYRIPTESIGQAAGWLRSYLGDAESREWAYPYSVSERYAARAYAVYALSLHAQPLPNYFAQLFQKRDQLPFDAKAYLLKAGRNIRAPAGDVDLLADELLNQSRVAPATMYFEDPLAPLRWIPQSNVKTTALTLQALLAAKGGFPNDDRVIRWLTQERKVQGRWRTTHENAAALWAFQDYYRRYEKDPPDFAARLDREGGGAPAMLWSAPFRGRSLLALAKEFDPGDIFGGSGDEARLAFRKEGAGRLYYVLRYAYVPAGYDRPAAEGLSVERSVKSLAGAGRDMRAGARAIVTLRVKSPQDRTFVALEDHLPGGFEIVDPSYSVEGREQTRTLAGEENGRDRYWGGFQRSENYDDRVVVFADYLPAGEHAWSYLVQATTPGRFHWPSARIEGMYEPEIFGRTASDAVQIKK